MKLDVKQLTYFKKWESLRSNRLKYLFKRALLINALPFSIFMILFELVDSRFVFSYKILTDFSTIFLIAFVLGILEALFTYKTNDKRYLEFKAKYSD